MKEYVAGRTVYCHNSDCDAHGKTLFRQVIVEAFLDHDKVTFTCNRCGSMHILEMDVNLTNV